MKRLLSAPLLVLLIFFLPCSILAEEPKSMAPDKALSAEMLRYGKQAYSRGKYLDAKEFFRKALQADPTSDEAWKHYDMAVIFGLAKRVEKDTDLITPESSSSPSPAPAPKKEKFIIVDDEGC